MHMFHEFVMRKIRKNEEEKKQRNGFKTPSKSNANNIIYSVTLNLNFQRDVAQHDIPRKKKENIFNTFYSNEYVVQTNRLI